MYPDTYGEGYDGGGSSGFSGKTACVGLCGVCPAMVWLVALCYMSWYAATADEVACVAGNIPAYIYGSLAGYLALVVIQCVNAFTAGEPDFEISPAEYATFGCSALVLIGLFIFNYYGCVQVVNEHSSCNLNMMGWVALVGNNIVWFATLASSVASLFLAAMVAGTDKMANAFGYDL